MLPLSVQDKVTNGEAYGARAAACLSQAMRDGVHRAQASVLVQYSVTDLAFTANFSGAHLKLIVVSDVPGYPPDTTVEDLLSILAQKKWLGLTSVTAMEQELRRSTGNPWHTVKVLLPLLTPGKTSQKARFDQLKLWVDQGNAIDSLTQAGCHEEVASLCQRSCSAKPPQGKCSLEVLKVFGTIVRHVQQPAQRTAAIKALVEEWKACAAEAEAAPRQYGRRRLNHYNSNGLKEAWQKSKHEVLRSICGVSHAFKGILLLQCLPCSHYIIA